MYDVNTHDVRRYFGHVWQNRLNPLQLDALQQKALRIIEAHPEYQTYLEHIEDYLDKNWTPEQGETNPFLHLSMHLSISEQISIDQPPGIRAASVKLSQKLDDEHAAQHMIMECLGRMLWQAQRDGKEPDAAAYIEHILQLAS